MRSQTRDPSAAGLVVGAAALLTAAICVCVGLTWGHTDIDDGLSWFGTLGRTVVPYSVGLVGTSLLLWGAERHTPDSVRAGPTRAVLAWTAALLIGLAVSPYTVGRPLETVHRLIGSLLFAGQLLYSLWVARERREPLDAVLVVVQLVAGAVCFLYFVIGLMGVMLVGQLTFQAAVLAVLHREVSRLERISVDAA